MPIIAKLQNGTRPHRRRRRLKSLAFVPTLMTLGNLVCGFAAICYAMVELGTGQASGGLQVLPAPVWERMLPSFLSLGAGLVILGLLFDGLDGLLARVTRSTTAFGGQLDSLADIVTFGVAPAALMVVALAKQLATNGIFPSPSSAHFLGRMVWVPAAVFVAFAAIRLARYNVEHAKADFDYKTFRGLPSPGAGLVMVSLIILHDDPDIGQTARAGIVYAMPFVALASAFLMVSRIPYKRFHRTYLLGRRPFGQFVGFVAIFALFWLYKAPMLALLAFWYWGSGPLALLLGRLRRTRLATPVTEDEHPDDDHADDDHADTDRLRA